MHRREKLKIRRKKTYDETSLALGRASFVVITRPIRHHEIERRESFFFATTHSRRRSRRMVVKMKIEITKFTHKSTDESRV